MSERDNEIAILAAIKRFSEELKRIDPTISEFMLQSDYHRTPNGEPVLCGLYWQRGQQAKAA